MFRKMFEEKSINRCSFLQDKPFRKAQFPDICPKVRKLESYCIATFFVLKTVGLAGDDQLNSSEALELVL